MIEVKGRVRPHSFVLTIQNTFIPDKHNFLFSCLKSNPFGYYYHNMGLCVSKTPPSSFAYVPVSLKLSSIYSLGFSKPSRRKFCSVSEGSFQEYSILKRKTPLLTLNDLLDFYSCLSGKKANRSNEYCCCRLKKTDCLYGRYFYSFMCYAT